MLDGHALGPCYDERSVPGQSTARDRRAWCFEGGGGLVFRFVPVVLSIAADPAVLVMHYAVLSQQNESRELPTARCSARGRGAHLRKQVQGSVAHGTGGDGFFRSQSPRLRLIRDANR